MNVVQVVGAYAPERCGIAHYTRRLVGGLRHAGIEAVIAGRPAEAVADPAAPRAVNPGREDEPPVLAIRSRRWTLSTLLGLVRLAAARRADWLHLQYAPSSYDWERRVGLLPLVARLVPGAPRVITTVHEYGGWPLSAHPLLEPFLGPTFGLAEREGWLDRETLTLLSLSDRVLATNPKHLAAIGERSPRLAGRLQVVPIGPNVGPDAAPEDRTTARRALGVAPDRFVLAFFGFVHPVKGIETLLRALARAREARPDLLLWIVGGVHSLALRGDEANGYEATIRALIGELGLADIVTMTGFQPDSEVGRVLRAADLAVLPFNHGATMKSGTLVTCLSYGLPVLTTGGPEGAGLGPGSGAWVVPPRDPAALSEAILHLAADADLRRDLGRAGLSASETYGWSRIVEEHRRIYLEDRGRVSAGGASGGAPSRDDLRRHRALGPAALR